MANHVGSLTRKEHPEQGTYFEGVLHMEHVHGRAYLVPAEKRKDNSPDFKLKLRKAGGIFEYGAAWLGKMKGPDGAEYVSITIQAPGVPTIYVKAFPADDQPDDLKDGETLFNVIWNPSRSAASAPSRGGPALDDEIPF